MQVDGTPAANEPPPLPVLLAHVVTSPVSAPALRLAIRKHLRDAEDLTCVLQVLVGWLEAWTAQDVALLPIRTTKDPHGATVPVIEETKVDAPPVDKVSFLRFSSFET